MRRRRTFRKFKKEKPVDLKKFEECIKNLHPMALGVMVSETNKIGANPKTSFEEYIVKSTKALLDKKIQSPKWISAINSFVEKKIKEMSAEDPEHEPEDKIVLRNVTIVNLSKKQSQFGCYHSVIAINESGWKYHFSSSKISKEKVGDRLNISGTVKGNSEGITFLSRVKAS